VHRLAAKRNRPTACRGDTPGGHRAGTGTEPARRTAVATRGPEGISDEDAAWIDGLAQRLDVANHAAQARPIPNWRSKPSAVVPVDDIDWV
jgi:hypothetical protein